jgi:hypothetical protein
MRAKQRYAASSRSATRVAQLDKLRSHMVPFAGFFAPAPCFWHHLLATIFLTMSASATHAPAEIFGASMIATIVVVERVVVSGPLRRPGCGICV